MYRAMKPLPKSARPRRRSGKTASPWKALTALKGALRENGGKGVHFSGPGLREHAARWAEKVIPWLQQRLGRK
jgi:hypothetical protein